LQGVFGDFFKNSQLIQNLLSPLASAFPPERRKRSNAAAFDLFCQLFCY
jgi:hypothetical protein